MLLSDLILIMNKLNDEQREKKEKKRNRNRSEWKKTYETIHKFVCAAYAFYYTQKLHAMIFFFALLFHVNWCFLLAHSFIVFLRARTHTHTQKNIKERLAQIKREKRTGNKMHSNMIYVWFDSRFDLIKRTACEYIIHNKNNVRECVRVFRFTSCEVWILFLHGAAAIEYQIKMS